MNGANIIAIIILATIVIAVAVYLLHWLYRRSTKDISFVRTGFGGEKVVMGGGALVLPIVHDVTEVSMNTLRLEVRRAKEQSLITKDRMRVEVTVEFFVRVIPQPEAVATAARTLGRRTMNPESLKDLVQGRFVDAMGMVAATMTMEEMHEHRGKYIKGVRDQVAGSLTQ
ncbi:MAG: SPFH domain-containing protein, partial [Bradyrhizobium sp.]